MLTLYDAARCPYCARARIVLAEKGVEYEAVEVDLSDRPAWIYEKNATGRVPVLEDGAWVLPESAVIMEYLEERYPEPALLAADVTLGGADYGLADIAYVPWVLRARDSVGVRLDLHPAVAGWLERLLERPALAAEASIVAAL